MRQATPEEALAIFTPVPSYETWVAVLTDGESILGQICLTRRDGVVFGHNTECNSDEENAAAKLFFAARQKVREWGYDKVAVHIEPGTPKRIMDFWKALGAKPLFMLFEVAV